MPSSHSTLLAVTDATPSRFFLASNSSPTVANVLARDSACAAFARRLWAAGSIPSRNSALASLRRRYVTARELAADRQASAACGPSALAGALLKVGAGPRWANLGAAAAMAGDDSLD